MASGSTRNALSVLLTSLLLLGSPLLAPPAVQAATIAGSDAEDDVAEPANPGASTTAAGPLHVAQLIEAVDPGGRIGADATSHLASDASTQRSPREAALAKLAQALEDLPERDRILLRGAFYEKRSYTELAEEIGVRTDSVGQLLYRAKRKLKKNLGGDGFLESLSGLLLVCLPWLMKGGWTP